MKNRRMLSILQRSRRRDDPHKSDITEEARNIGLGGEERTKIPSRLQYLFSLYFPVILIIGILLCNHL